MFILLGVGCFICAVVWWLLYFEQMLSTAVKQASQCFYYTTIECDAVNVMDLFFDIPAYSPVILWIAASLFSFGGILHIMVGTDSDIESDTSK